MLSNSNRDSSKEVAVIRGEGSGSGSGSRSESRERRHRLLLYFKQPPVLNRIVRFYSNSFSCRSMQHTFRTEHTIPAFNISLPCPLRSLLELSPCILQVDCELSIYFFIFIGCCYYYQEIQQQAGGGGGSKRRYSSRQQQWRSYFLLSLICLHNGDISIPPYPLISSIESLQEHYGHHLEIVKKFNHTMNSKCSFLHQLIQRWQTSSYGRC